MAGSRALQDGGHLKPPARIEKRGRIPLPIFVIEIHRQKEASLVLQHGIDAHDKIQAPVIPARKMPADHFVSDLKKAAIGTIRAFDSRLFADAANPFIGAGRRIAGFPGPPALESPGINILSAPEKRSKQLYLGSRWRMIRNRGAWLLRNVRIPHQRPRFVADAFVNRFHAAIIRQQQSRWRIPFGPIRAGATQCRFLEWNCCSGYGIDCLTRATKASRSSAGAKTWRR